VMAGGAVVVPGGAVPVVGGAVPVVGGTVPVVGGVVTDSCVVEEYGQALPKISDLYNQNVNMTYHMQ
jgi:hypothetical protein